MVHQARIKQLVTQAIRTFDLSLAGLKVLTEAATGYYCFTPLVAAMAGANQVLALTRDSRYGSAASVETQTTKLAQAWGLQDRIELLFDRQDPRLASVDVVTNLGFVRPLDEPFLGRLSSSCAISLMWETWEHRPEELDLAACRRRGLAVLGTNEHHADLQTFQYTGIIAAKLLLALEIELFRSTVAVLGSGEFAADVMARLAAWGAEATLIPPSPLGPDQRRTLARADALLVAEPRGRDPLIGPGGLIDAAELSRSNPTLAIAHICGGVDREGLAARGHPCAPERFAPPPHMSVATDFVGPRPVIELHTAGLAVGAALARARRAGLNARQAEARVVAECAFAQGFDDQSSAPPSPLRSPGPPPGPAHDTICLTLDVDWAPDPVIEWVAALLVENQVKATWFVTHQSPALDRLRSHPELFELGLHPNFMPGSTQGRTEEEVLAHCLALLPEARSMRTHGLWQSTLLFQKVLQGTNRLRTDVSLLTFGAPQVVPFEHRYRGRSLWRLPYQWEDTFAMEADAFPQQPLDTACGGLKVFSFHPIHVYLNSENMNNYNRMKEACPSLVEAEPAGLAPYRAAGLGMGQRFRELVARLAGDPRCRRVDDLARRWSGARRPPKD